MSNIKAVPLTTTTSTGRNGLTLRARQDSAPNSWRRPLNESGISPGTDVVVISQADYDTLMLPHRLVERHNQTMAAKPVRRRGTQKRPAKRGSKGFKKVASRSKRATQR